MASHSSRNQQTQDAGIKSILHHLGLINPYQISNSLQGGIWRASQSTYKSIRRKPKSSVIKVTNQYLQQKSIAKIGSKTIPVYENIISEASILKYLTQSKQCPSSIVKFHKFLKSETDYFLIMEDGGGSLFDFVMNAHRFIQLGMLEISHWIQVVKVIFKQMIECIQFIHNKSVCHFDISLENFVINDVMIYVHENIYSGKKIIKVTLNDIQVKLCDFGLSELFTTRECKSSKYCGKTGYQSPEIIDRVKPFDAKKNDIWCVGVTLFMMLTGNAPWSVAKENDQAYKYMVGGFMKGVLKSWDLLKFVDDDLLDLFDGIFQNERNRMSLKQIQKHSWMKK